MEIDQSTLIRDFIKEKVMSNCNSVNIPMKAGNFIYIPKADNYKKAELKTYQELIRKLMYLLYGTKPNIVFIVDQLSRQNANPCIGHLKATKRVVRYLKGKINFGITYGFFFWSTKQIKHLYPPALSSMAL